MREESKGLTIKQARALELTLKGMSDLEVARRVKVSRQTVNEWRNQNLAFMEMLDTRRKLAREQHMDSLNELIEEAVTAARGALHSQNEVTRLKAAALVLRISGLQGCQKAEANAEGGMAEFARLLSAAIGDAAEELGFSDPTMPDRPKQISDGRVE